MALTVVSMEELKLQVLLEPERTGETIAELCARHGISRASFYRYRRRYLEEGLAGLEPRSRRPRFSPAQIEPALEARIVELRKRHRPRGHTPDPRRAQAGRDRAAGGGDDPPRASAQPPGRPPAAPAGEGGQALRARGL
jgi:transposase-like protein